MTGKIRLLSSLAVCAIVTAATASAAEPRREEKPPYRIVDGKVDEATFLGWRAYHSACHSCHGVDATGTEAWESDTSMRPHVMDLYAYLRARADGALGPGKPQRMEE